MFLNADVPRFYCLLRKEFLYDLRAHRGEFVRVCVFGVASLQGRALGFHVMTENGAQIARLPLHALVHRTDAPSDVPLDHLELWDCPSPEIAVTEFKYLAGLRCRTVLKSRAMYEGQYLMTFDWCGTPDSEDAGDGGHKNAHLIKLDCGLFAAQPNNRIFWNEPAFIVRPFLKRPDYRTNTRVWKVEGTSRWTTEASDRYFYDTHPAPGNGHPQPGETPPSETPPIVTPRGL